jgi:hypothetical protein
LIPFSKLQWLEFNLSKRDLFMPTLDFSETPSRGKATSRKSLKMVLGIGVISGAFALSSTLAANIALNDSGTVEFGQGIVQTTACSDGQSLIVTPLSSFTNAAGEGSFDFTGVTVSRIPESCRGVDFKISAYNTSGDALPIFNTNSTVATIWNDAGIFKLGTGTLNGASIESNSEAFTVSFTSPVALATNVSRVTLQSSAHSAYSCAQDLICEPGDIGPGGGTVFYKNIAGFNCGPDHTSTGSPTGGKCNYLEFAPPTWSGHDADPYGNVTTSASNIASVGVSPANARTLSEIGRGFKYSNAINAAFGTCSSLAGIPRLFSGSACPTASGMARAYRGGGLSDWYLTNAAELNVACQYARGGQAINPNVACARVGTDFPVGFTRDDHFTSSAVSTNLAMFYSLHMMVTDSFGPNSGHELNFLVKPIRAF